MTDNVNVAVATRGTAYPARSKMLDMYATDIAVMLTESRFELAERHSVSIPHIAIALSDAALQSSRVAYMDWCMRWVQPNFGIAVYEEWCTRSGECGSDKSEVPFAALRTLRLQRRAREVRSGFSSYEPNTPAHSTQAVSCALLGAEFRWYEREGRYQSIVQTNLARLGVLR
jgi:hypothetical protein